MEKLKSGPVITNHSFLVTKLLLYLNEMGNSFSNKIKTNKIQGKRKGGRAPSSAFSGKGQTLKFGLELSRHGNVNI